MQESKDVTYVVAERLIGHVKGNTIGPTIVFFAGIHGNEPAGVTALQSVFTELQQHSLSRYRGEVYGIAGNLSALAKNVRFLKEDLNRIWFPDRLSHLSQNPKDLSEDAQEMLVLNEFIHQIIATASPPFYFIDLHTTSGATDPFVIINDSLLNRKFVKQYPLPIILGIEEYLTGALLSHINEMGYVSFGFESGQHEDPKAIKNAENFIWYTLHVTGYYSHEKEESKKIKEKLELSSGTENQFYEIYYQYLIQEGQWFQMLPGFANFQTVPKATSIAMNGKGLITTDKTRQLFMPLYQNSGNEGFYFIRDIPNFFLGLSKFLRRFKIDHLLVLLPGIKWASPKHEALRVNKKVTRFMAKPFFHLLGYRTRRIDTNHWVLKSRERHAKTAEYTGAPWW